ncbi:MAG TPA: GNAT family N-acetyltransferase [Candidatus Eisenbacteria bacterium]|nr:GNAT family N-acetyltransferase [Candidatus Eisenbacteria bacterium]
MTTLETERLLLRSFHAEDLDAYAAMHADPEVVRYLGDRMPLSREDAWRSMAMILGHWTLRGFGLWAVEEKATGALVGRVGLFEPDGWPGQEVGWTLAREHWGKGYAFEAASSSLDHAFHTLAWPRAISLIDPANHRSIRLAERLGERFEREIEIRGRPTRLYAIERSDWRPHGA